MAPRVLVSDDLSAEGVEIMRRAGLEVDVKVGLKPDALEAIIGDYDALAVRSATKVTRATATSAATITETRIRFWNSPITSAPGKGRR